VARERERGFDWKKVEVEVRERIEGSMGFIGV